MFNASACHALLASSLTLALWACAEITDNPVDDGRVERHADGPWEGGGWPDFPVYPDGQPPGGRAMYAHSKAQLFVIDPDTLGLSLVGTFGPDAPDINDLAVTPGGEVYAISINDLYRVDATTAQLTHVATVAGTANAGLTFEATGTLLAADKSGTLRRIDPDSGQVTEIGTYGANLGESGDLVAIKDGTLFGVNDVGVDGAAKENNELMRVNPTTAKAQVIGAIGYDRVWGLAYWRGTIYGLTKEGELLAIDPLTGKGTLKGTFPHEFWGAAVSPLAPIE